MVKRFEEKRSPVAARFHQPKKSCFPWIFWPLVGLVIIFAIFIAQNKYLYITTVSVKYLPANAKYRLTDQAQITKQLNDYINQPWLNYFKKDTPLTFSTQYILSHFAKDGRFASTKIIWRFPHKIELALYEKVPVAILSVSGDKDYWLDKNGE
ncbi:MAG: hypothetical protein PHY10_02990, partial [Patescibacteria group bacterium]|nr:hypothetical protein [Patescibacteria group bacterium]